MAGDRQMKINARGLPSPGPRMMVKRALADNECQTLRVVVSYAEAVEDLKEYFKSLHVTAEVDQIGDEFHLFVDLSSSKKNPA